MSDTLFRRLCAILAVVLALGSLTIAGPLLVGAVVLLAVALLV